VTKPKEQRIETEEFVSHLQSFQKLSSPTMGNSTQTVHQFLTGHPNASVTVHLLQKTKPSLSNLGFLSLSMHHISWLIRTRNAPYFSSGLMQWPRKTTYVVMINSRSIEKLIRELKTKTSDQEKEKTRRGRRRERTPRTNEYLS
jgi:hypothetical protein